MGIENVKTITVIGAGSMGQQIGMLCAMHGYETYVAESNPAQLERAQKFANEYLPGRVAKGRITQEKADEVAGLLHFESDIAVAAKDADFVIEAVFEDLGLKRQIFKQLEGICKPETVFATNASRIVSSEIAAVLENPGRICNMQFNNPALVMECVEVMRGTHTTDEAFEIVCAVAENLGKKVCRIQKEIFGMVSSRIIEVILREALSLVARGYVTPADVDNACRGALGHKMGPFETEDLIGIDCYYRACMDRYSETGDVNDQPPTLIVEKFAKGEWGRKTGKGFYDYTDA